MLSAAATLSQLKTTPKHDQFTWHFCPHNWQMQWFFLWLIKATSYLKWIPHISHLKMKNLITLVLSKLIHQ